MFIFYLHAKEVYYFREVIESFFGTHESLFRKVLRDICKNSSLKFLIFFLTKLSTSLVYKKFLERRLFSFSWTKNFAFSLTAKRANCQNGVRSRRMLVKYFFAEWARANKNGSVLTNKYCKTEVHDFNKKMIYFMGILMNFFVEWLK